MHTVTVVGCGYTGLRLLRRWLEVGCEARGFGSRPQSLPAIAATGAAAAILDLDAAAPTRIEAQGHLVYYTVPPAPTGDHDPRLERLLSHIDGKPQRFVYLSTTGVYGDRQGALVDEETVPAPKTSRAVRRLAAEHTLREWAEAAAVSWCILRVPGIYGPGRLPLDRLRREEPAIQPTDAMPGNRIHVDDLVTTCVAAGSSAAAARRIYNVTDGSNDSATAFLQRVAVLAGLPQPPLVSRTVAEKTFAAASWSFLSESRRVDNRRMLAELDVALAYQDLDAGIRASL